MGISMQNQANAFWSLIEAFSGPLFGMLMIPILIKAIGIAGYGEFVMLMALVGLLAFSGFGMNTTITYFLASQTNTQSSEDIAQKLVTALCITLVGTLSVSLILLLTFHFASGYLALNYPKLYVAKNDLPYVFLYLIISQADSVLSAAFKGLQAFSLSSRLEFAIRFMVFIANVASAMIFKSITLILMSLVVFSAIGLYIRLKFICKLPHLYLGRYLKRAFCNKVHFKEQLKFGRWMVVQVVAASLYSSLDKIIIGSVMGTSVAGVYNVLLSVTQFVHIIPANSMGFVFSKLTKNKYALTFNMLKTLSRIVFSSAIIVAALLFIGRPVIFNKLHIHNDYIFLFNGLLISHILLAINIPLYYMALSDNKIKAVSIQCLAGALLGILFLILTIKPLGLWSAIGSKLIYSILALFLLIPVINILRSRLHEN